MNFDIKTEQVSDDAYVISLAGEVDLYTAPEFKQQLLEVIGQGGKDVIVDFTEHDVHRLDDARRARRRRQAPPLERRPAVARLQRPQHHEDLRDHGPRPGLHDLSVPRRSGGDDRSVHNVVRAAAAAALAVLALAASGCGSGVGTVVSARRRQVARQAALHREVRAPATRSPTRARQGKIGPNLDAAFRPSTTSRASRSRRSGRSSPTRSSSPATTARAGPTMPANLVDRRRRDDVAAYVAAVAGPAGGSRPSAAAAPPPHRPRRAPRRRRPEAAPISRRARTRSTQRLRRVPHVRAPRARPGRSAPTSTS